MAPRRVTEQDLRKAGVPDAKIKEIMADLEKPKPRTISMVFKAPEDRIIRLAKENPDITFARRFKPRAARKAKAAKASE